MCGNRKACKDGFVFCRTGRLAKALFWTVLFLSEGKEAGCRPRDALEASPLNSLLTSALIHWLRHVQGPA
jgi:hypothetical protein